MHGPRTSEGVPAEGEARVVRRLPVRLSARPARGTAANGGTVVELPTATSSLATLDAAHEHPLAPPEDAQPLDDGGVWPRTNRVLPWLVAIFLFMLWLVPFPAILAPFSVGVDSKLDRLVLIVMVVVWVILAVVPNRYGPRFRRSPLNVAIGFLMVVDVASVLVRLPVLTNLGETSLATKKLALLFSYVLFFYFVATVVRGSEVRNFTKYMVILATLTAVGTIIEYRTQTNYFYIWSAKLLPGFGVGLPPGPHKFGRPDVVGPTGASLADATILAIALPFAIVFLFGAKGRRDKFFWYIATALILVAAMSTVRKSAVVVPAATLLTVFLLSPRQMFRHTPALVVCAAVLHVASPGAASTVLYQFTHFNETSSTQGRTDDYPAVTPDILAHPVLGRGYGTYDPHIYRILDNQYLLTLVETGFVGLAAYFILLGTGAALAYKAARANDPSRSPPARALMAAIVGFGVASFTFDVLSFAEAPYLLLFILGLAVVAAADVPAWARRAPPAKLRAAV